MFKVEYREHFNSPYIQVLHDSIGNGNKLSAGKISQSINAVNTFQFDVGLKNSLYNEIEPINGIVRVINLKDDAVEFEGRVLKPKVSMTRDKFAKSFVAEDFMSYFNDSIQVYNKVANTGIRNHLEQIINFHNSQVEPFKQFKVGLVTVENDTDIPYRWIGYESTLKSLRTFRESTGGIFYISNKEDGLYLNYVKESDLGQRVDSPLQLGKNIISARKSVSFEDLVTRLVPLGSDLKTDTSNQEDYGQKVTHPRLTIESVNGGQIYLEDRELVSAFGIIQKEVSWNDIDDAQTLKNRGQQYLEGQSVALSTWDVEVVDLSLLYERYQKLEVGNYHQIINPPMSSVEELQIISKEIDIINPQRSRIRVGSDPQSLSAYLLQQQEARQSIEKVIQDSARNQESLVSAQAELERLQGLYDTGTQDQSSLSERIAELERQIAALGGA